MAAVGPAAEVQLRHRPALPALQRDHEAQVLPHQSKEPAAPADPAGEPTKVKGKAPARGPPYFASKVLRRHFGEHAPQMGMFD
jgi:hypothetical protein